MANIIEIELHQYEFDIYNYNSTKDKIDNNIGGLVHNGDYYNSPSIKSFKDCHGYSYSKDMNDNIIINGSVRAIKRANRISKIYSILS